MSKVIYFIMLIGMLAFSGTAIAEEGNWLLSISEDLIDDSEKVVLMSMSINKNHLGNQYKLIIRCTHTKTDLYIVWGEYISENDPQVTTRLDKNKPENIYSTWRISTDKVATFYNGQGDMDKLLQKDNQYNTQNPYIHKDNDSGTVSFIKKMMKSKTFVARITPYQESPITAVFNIRGLSNAIIPLRECCEW